MTCGIVELISQSRRRLSEESGNLYILAASDSATAESIQDPHLTLAHGGMADFRGYDKTLYNWITSPLFALNGKTENATFMLEKVKVFGSFITEAHVVALSEKNRYLNVSFYADNLNEWQTSTSMVKGFCGNRAFNLSSFQTISCDELSLRTKHSSYVLLTRQWDISVHGQPVYRSLSGPKHRLDVIATARVTENLLSAHGIIGQSFDGDGKPRFGRRDVYPMEGDFTTSAQAEGAIEGNEKDYVLTHKFDIMYTHSRF